VTEESQLDRSVEAVLSGDREAYRDVIAQCEANVRVVLAAIVPDVQSVDDLAQEVFVTAYAKLSEFQLGRDFRLWIKGIARHLALNERRRWFRNVRFRGRFEAEIERTLDPLITGFGEAYEGNVLEALRACLAELESPSRTLVEEFYFQELSSDQIARRLGKKAGWVRVALFRARSSLGLCLEKKGVS
jgi:RNA polymerase sigma-70 factor (ECF subfamily)